MGDLHTGDRAETAPGAPPTALLDFRLQVLAAGGLNSHSDTGQALRAYKAAWEVYLLAGFACGLFEGIHGADLRARLTGTDDDNFRSAMSECLAAWYLAGKLKLPIGPRPQGRPGHPLEFVIKLPDGDVNVEVKCPHRPITTEAWWGDDSDLLQRALHTANKQFEAGARNSARGRAADADFDLRAVPNPHRAGLHWGNGYTDTH